MRYALGPLLAVAFLGLVGLSESEAAPCRAAGEYRVTGPTIGGLVTLRETSSDESSSSGTVDMALAAKGGVPVGLIAGQTLTGKYYSAPNWDGSCFVSLRTFDAFSNLAGGVGGTLAFGGAVIFFEGYDTGPGPITSLDLVLNLTLGIRTDSLLRP